MTHIEAIRTLTSMLRTPPSNKLTEKELEDFINLAKDPTKRINRKYKCSKDMY